jgi:hypothetical protein
MNLFQIGFLFLLPVHTYLLTCETGYWLIFIYVYMTGCECHMNFSTFVFANESWHDHLGWTISTWRWIHWSDESRFLLCPTDGRARVWHQRNTSFQDNHILGTTAFGGGGVTIWGCFSFDCKLDLYVLDGNLTGQNYHDNVLAPCFSPPFRQSCVGWQANVHGRQR